MKDETLALIGKLLPPTAQRDAVHFALAPVVAAERLAPGQHVGLDQVRGDIPWVSATQPYVGIIDPFLPHPAAEGDHVYLYLYPHTITSLRHQWTHPAFPDEAPTTPVASLQAASQAWIRRYAEDNDLSYRQLIAAAQEYLNTGEDTCLGFDTPDGLRQIDQVEEFWRQYEIFTGTVVKDKSAPFFRCAC